MPQALATKIKSLRNIEKVKHCKITMVLATQTRRYHEKEVNAWTEHRGGRVQGKSGGTGNKEVRSFIDGGLKQRGYSTWINAKLEVLARMCNNTTHIGDEGEMGGWSSGVMKLWREKSQCGMAKERGPRSKR